MPYPVDELNGENMHLQRIKIPDAKESFECGREDDPGMDNIWLPDDYLPGFKEGCLDFFWVWALIQ